LTAEDFPDPEGTRKRYAALRTPGVGEKLVLDENFFIEQALRSTVLSGLSDEDLEAYGKPYPTRESRLPLLQWARSIPLDGEPADVIARVEAYDAWLASSPEIPKLLLTFEPNPHIMIGPDLVDWCAANIASLEIEACGPAHHLAPKDQPDAIAAAIVGWTDRHQLRSSDAPNSALAKDGGW
jgi:haloalkane dehalogenase